MTLLTIDVIAFSLAFWALLFWGSVRLICGPNPHNTLGAAIAWAALHLVVIFSRSMMPFAGIIMTVGWLVFMLRLLTSFYEIGTVRALLVVVALGLGPYFLLPMIVRVVGDNEVLDAAVFYGVPVAVFGAWLLPSLRARQARKHEAPVPAMRVEKQPRPSKPVLPHAASRQSAPVLAPTVAAPAPVARPVAPAAQGDAPAGEPTLLR